MSVRVEWLEAGYVSGQVFPPGNEDWIGSDDQGDDYVLCLSANEVTAIHGSREELLELAERIKASVVESPPLCAELDEGRGHINDDNPGSRLCRTCADDPDIVAAHAGADHG